MNFSKRVIEWQMKHGRHHLPWQKNNNPYHVWLSEIMLQQTQVTTVINYFERFIEALPTIRDLAEANEDKVFKLWAGLGYYARARNMHASAKIIQENFNGIFPNTFEDVLNLPGIGRSTAGAILAFSYNQHYPILDGNVKRVLMRFHGLKMPKDDPQTIKDLWQIAEKLLPASKIRNYTQGLMDLGATICKPKKANCKTCPLKKKCKALALNLVNEIPSIKKRQSLPIKTKQFLIATYKGEVFLIKNHQDKIWQGLWILPEFQELQNTILYFFQQGLFKELNSGSRKTVFTHFILHFTYTHIELLKKPKKHYLGLWFDKHELQDIGLPAPLKKLLSQILR